jgi:hypothetical protein
LFFAPKGGLFSFFGRKKAFLLFLLKEETTKQRKLASVSFLPLEETKKNKGGRKEGDL